MLSEKKRLREKHYKGFHGDVDVIRMRSELWDQRASLSCQKRDGYGQYYDNKEII